MAILHELRRRQLCGRGAGCRPGWLVGYNHRLLPLCCYGWRSSEAAKEDERPAILLLGGNRDIDVSQRADER